MDGLRHDGFAAVEECSDTVEEAAKSEGLGVQFGDFG